MPFLQPTMTRIMSGTNPGFTSGNVNYPGTGADIYQRASQHAGQNIWAGTGFIIAGTNFDQTFNTNWNSNTLFYVSPVLSNTDTPVNTGILYSVYQPSNTLVVLLVDPTTGSNINATEDFPYNYVAINTQ